MSQLYQPVDWVEGHILQRASGTNLMKPAPGYDPTTADQSVYPDVVPASRDDAYLHHYTQNKWQMGGSYFKKIVKDGVPVNYADFSGLNIALREAGSTAGSVGPCGFQALHDYFAGGDAKRGPPSYDDYPVAFAEGYGHEFDCYCDYYSGYAFSGRQQGNCSQVSSAPL